MTTPVRVLLVEDSPFDAELLLDELRRGGLDPAHELVDTPEDVARALDRETWEIVVCDHGLRGFSVTDVIEMVRARELDLPVIVVSGAVGEESAVAIMKAGARDLIVKSNLARLVPAIQRELREAESRLERRRAEEALITELQRKDQELQREHDFVSAVIDTAPTFVCVVDSDGRIVRCNRTCEEMTGYSLAEVQGMPFWEVFVPPEEVDGVQAVLERARMGQVSLAFENQVVAKDGRRRLISWYNAPLFDEEGEGRYLVGVGVDVTEHRELEGRLRQAQKLEAVGRLAGGIAHDFNNLLTVITGYGELLVGRLGDEHEARQDADEIRKAAERAAALTRQLLAFSRRQVLQPRVVDLNAVVAGLEPMLRRLIGEDIEITCALGPAAGRVRADPGQLEQVIVNLAVNARDAMPGGGKLTIETAEVVLDEEYVREHLDVRPGPYALLAVTDTGHGMDAETLSHAFEPFFTTKGELEGTGLGLATVYGIVSQSDGYVWVYSEPGRGTTFKVYLPRVDGAPEPADPPNAHSESVVGSETVLVAEDDPAVRALVRRMLEEHGYTVLEASNGTEALAKAESHAGPIHLLVTDTVMPGMSGPDLAACLVSARPAARVLYTSGYADVAIVRHGVLDAGAAFIHKPFTQSALASKVREVLDATQ